MKDHSELFSIFKQILDLSKSLISDFKKTFGDEEIDRKLPMARVAYMETIIINLAKLFSRLKCDNFGIKQLKDISPKDCKEELAKIEIEHKEVIGKIISNRNMLVAHTDRKFYELCFSDDHIKKIEKAFDIDLKMPRALNKEKERYTPGDLKNDLPEINSFIEKLDKIWTAILMFHYSKK